ncbi:serine/threonine-protein kinase [Actinomycetospora sp. CA-053990]|uniref:serine/threonine-protein kinase n=1 Tax=Actinomycetospora sp. CA-053990 TaxID=3239891 RepID=UPI003D89FBD6
MADEGEVIAERYRVRTRVGQGAMGVVWRAEDERLQREVALKQVSLPAGADEEARDQAHRRVFREARMIARLHHPHAIAVYDVVEHDGQPWLVMEYLPSRSLAEALVADGPLDPERVAHIGRQVADALAAAHEAGMVHRDIKPGNVLLADDGLAKVTDFGIARAVDDVTITSTGMMAGTPAYLAPEVARGGTADFRSDVYSLGSTLYTALEGVPPFGTGDNPLAVLHRVASGEYAPPSPRGPITPLIEHLLQPDPASRPGMQRVRGDLARLVAAEAGTEEGPVTPFFVRPETPMSPGPGPGSGPPTPPPVPPGPSTGFPSRRVPAGVRRLRWSRTGSSPPSRPTSRPRRGRRRRHRSPRGTATTPPRTRSPPRTADAAGAGRGSSRWRPSSSWSWPSCSPPCSGLRAAGRAPRSPGAPRRRRPAAGARRPRRRRRGRGPAARSPAVRRTRPASRRSSTTTACCRTSWTRAGSV